MGTTFKKTEKTTLYGTVRDLLLAAVALELEIFSTDDLRKGRISLDEMISHGIGSGLLNILADRKVLERSRIRSLVAELERFSVRCSHCRKRTTILGVNSKDRFHCESCNSMLELEWSGPRVELSSSSHTDLDTYLSARLLRADDAAAEALAPKTRKPGAFESTQSSQELSHHIEQHPSPPRKHKPEREARAATHYPETSRRSSRTSVEEKKEKKCAPGKTSVSRVDVRKVVTDYAIETVIHSGPHGRLYRASSSEGALKAVKVLSPERTPNLRDSDQFQNALSSWATIDPKNLGLSHTLVRKEDATFIVRPFLEEPFTCLADLEIEDVATRIRILQIVTRNLARIHASGGVHGNLKPSNVFVRLRDKSDDAIFVDPAFQLVVPTDSEIERWKVLVNAPRYRSPEEIKGEEVNAATDVYALGWVFYAVLSGEAPFSGDAAPEILRRHVDGPCPRLSKESRGWAELVLAMTALKPQERPQDASDVLEHIERILAKKKPCVGEITERTCPTETAKATGGVTATSAPALFYLLGPLFLCLIAGYVGWCGYEWYKIRTSLSHSQRDEQLYHALAEESFYETRARSRKSPSEASALWDSYLQTFGDTPLHGAAKAEKRNFESKSD